MTDDDLIFKFRLALFSHVGETGNVREACRVFGVHHSTFYRWREQVLRSGLEMLRPRERRLPRMPNQASMLTGFYNHERAHTGRLTNGRTPAEVIRGGRKMQPR